MIDKKTREASQKFLHPSETIIWAGKSTGIVIMAEQLLHSLILLVMVSVLITISKTDDHFIFYIIDDPNTPFPFNYFPQIFISIIVLQVVGLVWSVWQRSSEIYVLTNTRGLIISGSILRKAHTVPFKVLSNMSRINFLGKASLVFQVNETDMTNFQKLFVKQRNLTYRFYNLKDASHAESKILNTLKMYHANSNKSEA